MFDFNRLYVAYSLLNAPRLVFGWSRLTRHSRYDMRARQALEFFFEEGTVAAPEEARVPEAPTFRSSRWWPWVWEDRSPWSDFVVPAVRGPESVRFGRDGLSLLRRFLTGGLGQPGRGVLGSNLRSPGRGFGRPHL